MNLNIFKMNTELKELQADNSAMLEKIKTLEADHAEAIDIKETFLMKQKTFDTQMETLKADHVKEIESIKIEFQKKLVEMESRLVAETNTENTKAATIVASLGVEAETIKVSTKSEKPNESRYVVVDYLNNKQTI